MSNRRVQLDKVITRDGATGYRLHRGAKNRFFLNQDDLRELIAQILKIAD